MDPRRFLGRCARLDPSKALLPLPAALGALGEQSWSAASLDDVAVDRILGSVARVDDFDRRMKIRNRHLHQRREQVGNNTTAWPPVDLGAAGELYFVHDGHHRVSVARERGMPMIEARVRRVCTVAYACACLTVLDLPSKAAETQFLKRLPVPDDVRPWLWLDDPDGWAIIEKSAETWLARHHRPLAAMTPDEVEIAVQNWWTNDVMQSRDRCHGRGGALDQYLCAIAATPDGCSPGC